MPTASKVLVRKGESALGRTSIATAATLLSSLKAEEDTSNSNMVEHELPRDNVEADVSATMRTERVKHDMSDISNNMEVGHELPEDDTFGVVTIFGKTTSLRYEIQQLRAFHETYGKSPTPNENRRLNELCSRLRKIRRDPAKANMHMGNVKPGEQLSDEIVSMLDSLTLNGSHKHHTPNLSNTLIHCKVVFRN